MVGRFDLGCRRSAKSVLAMGQAVLVTGILTACSSVPDAINPIEWYKGATDLVTGRERPEIASPAPAKGEFPDVNRVPTKTADQSKALPNGLVADRSNSQYAEPVRREVSPTRPLARRAPAAAETRVAKAEPVVPPKPVVQAAELPPKPAAQAAELPPKPAAQAAELPPKPVVAALPPEQPRVSADRRTPTARGDLAPDLPPALSMQPPPRADIPETVPMPGKGRPKPLQAQYEKRLAESAQQVVQPGMVEMPQPVLARGGEDAPIHLIPPGSAKKARSGGGKGMAAPLPAPAASFQVASVDFATGTTLSAGDRAAIAEVARLYRQTGGIVRVVGQAPAPSFASGDAVAQMMSGLDGSIQRANAVARELSKRGVPSAKILIGADPAGAAAGSAGAQVYLDVM